MKSNQSEDRTVESNASRKAAETRDELLERQHYLVECHNRIIMLMLNKKNLMNMFLLIMIIRIMMLLILMMMISKIDVDDDFDLDMRGRAIGALGVEHCISGGW